MFKKSITLLLLAVTVGACAVEPKALDQAEVSAYAQDKLARVTADQEPVHGAIGLYEAMARALKYNLDRKVEVYEEALRVKSLAVANQDGLPSLVSGLDYSGRSNVSASSSRVGNPPADSPVSPATSYSTSSENDIFTGEIRLSWNILDFGLSYVRAKQVADEIQIARENRRRIVNRIIEDVRTAYWRAVSADSLISGLRSLEGRVRRAMANSKALETDGESSPLTALTYQRELVEIQDEIQKLESELSIAKTQLAALMNIEPGTPYRLAQPARSAKRLKLTLGARQMVEFAVEHRPELRDVAYRERINALEAEKALLELFPSASLFLGGNASSNAFLYNNAWLDYGAKASWNVMKLFRYPERKLEIEAQRQLFDQRALAVTMAIMTQVHVGRARYHFAAKRFATAQQHLAIQSGILKQIKAAAAVDQVSEQTVIREEMNTLVSRVKYDIAYADLQNAYANIYASMGVDAIEEDFSDSESVAALSEKLRRAWLERGDTSGVITRIRKKHAPVEAAPADKPVAAVDQANPSTIVALTAKETGLQVSSEASATEAVVPVAKRQSRVRVATARD